MSAAVVRRLVIERLRAGFTPAEVLAVQPYAGEFSADEGGHFSFSTPAIFVAVLGWQPIKASPRLAGRHLRRLHLAAFVVTSAATRDERGDQALSLAERVALLLEAWVPPDTETAQIASLDEGCRVENLYSRQADARKQALWMVSWTQDTRALLPPAALADLVRIEITDDVRRGEPGDTTPPAAPPIVTEDVRFVPDEPTA